MVMVYAGGHFSGGHYNPAVTLGVTLRGKLPWAEAIPYMVAQVIGAVVAAGSSCSSRAADRPFPAPPKSAEYAADRAGDRRLPVHVRAGLCGPELATARGTAGNSFYGLAIGFTVMTGAFAVGPVSGGAFNPAVGVGVFVMGLANVTSLIIYLVADFLGGAAAALLFNALDMGGDRKWLDLQGRPGGRAVE